MGVLPIVGRAVEAVARRHGIAGVRTAVERPTLAWLTEIRRSLNTAALSGLAWFNRRQMGVLRHGPRSWGYFESGRLDEIRILEIWAAWAPASMNSSARPARVTIPRSAPSSPHSCQPACATELPGEALSSVAGPICSESPHAVCSRLFFLAQGSRVPGAVNA